MKNNFLTLLSFVFVFLFSGSGSATAQVTCNPSFTYAQTGSNYLTYTFTNTTVASSSSYQSYYLYLLVNNTYLTTMSPIGGNGTTAQYTFNGPGVYKVVLAMDDSSSLGYCHAYDTQTVVINSPTPANVPIQGNIYALHDSINNPSSFVYPNLSFKVWLIQYDASTNLLTAVDSQIVNGTNAYMVPYAFSNQPNGNYLVKAKDLLGLTYNGAYMVPTYHNSSMYWSNATPINHSVTGPVYNRNVWMLGGAQTSGPGFIGGNVTQGANRPGGANTLAIGDPVVNMDIYLKDETTGYIVGYTTTDMQGHYAFASLPLGTYTVFPDAISFETIPDEHITLVNSGSSTDTRHFTQTSTQVKPVSPTALDNVKVELVGVYPNPVTDKLTINWKNQVKEVTVKMYNINGQEVYTAAKPVTTIDMHHLAKGIYVLKINAGNAVQTLKIGKQ